MKRIRLLPKSLRPREKILKYGAEALTIEELLSVILITGSKGSPVNQISSKVAKLIQASLKNIGKSLDNLKLGPSKTAQILAVGELIKRFNDNQTKTLTSAKDVYINSLEIVNEDKETLLCFYINGRGELVKKEIIAVGSLNQVNLLPREIFSLIKELPIAGIILVHNHPSGVLDPSDEDIIFTKRVKEAGDILGVKLLDHLIVSRSGWQRVS